MYQWLTATANMYLTSGNVRYWVLHTLQRLVGSTGTVADGGQRAAASFAPGALGPNLCSVLLILAPT